MCLHHSQPFLCTSPPTALQLKSAKFALFALSYCTTLLKVCVSNVLVCIPAVLFFGNNT